jgi:hypothetical protein
MRMLRSLLTAIVLASAAGACGGGGSGPKVVAGAPAGDVTEVSGTVTATRDGKARPLAVGDEVSGDDIVETGADGHVAIRLRHNLVPWTLGPGKKETVSASLAWKAPRASEVAAGPTGERSGAAGRHAEREAADTAATATATANEEADMETAKVARADEPAPAAAAVAAAPPAPTEAPKMEERAPAMQPPPPAAPERAQDEAMTKALGDTAADDSFGAGGLGLSGTGEGGGGGGGGSIGLGDIGTLGHGSGTGVGQGYGAGAGKGAVARKKPMDAKPIIKVFNATGGLDIAVVARVVRTRNARLAACVDPVAPARAMVRITIKPDGKVDQVQVSGVPAAPSACLEKWMRATSFPSAKAQTSAGVLVQGVDPMNDL